MRFVLQAFTPAILVLHALEHKSTSRKPVNEGGTAFAAPSGQLAARSRNQTSASVREEIPYGLTPPSTVSNRAGRSSARPMPVPSRNAASADQ